MAGETRVEDNRHRPSWRVSLYKHSWKGSQIWSLFCFLLQSWLCLQVRILWECPRCWPRPQASLRDTPLLLQNPFSLHSHTLPHVLAPEILPSYYSPRGFKLLLSLKGVPSSWPCGYSASQGLEGLSILIFTDLFKTIRMRRCGTVSPKRSYS